MPLANSADTYGAVTKTFHWLTALLIFAAFPLGYFANELSHEVMRGGGGSDAQALTARTVLLFSLHKTVGVTVFFVALARIAWALAQPKPGLLNAGKPAERLLAQTIHYMLYGALVLVPLTGWIDHAATTGFAPIWWPFGQSLPFVPKSQAVAALFARLHFVLMLVLLASVLLHIAGALKHHLIDGDSTLRRMLPGRTEVRAPATPEGRLPQLIALAVFVLALTFGGLSSQRGGAGESAGAVPALEAPPSEWVVQDGTLAIGVQQLGSAVSGSFADWTAAIDFSEVPVEGRHGSVEVTIAIDSLSLGAVTGQAMGPDYFDAERHPTAIFAAEILPGDTAGTYLAEGTVTLKGASAPVALPFTLNLDGETAIMSGATSLNRRDYDIGAGQSDANLGPEVTVTVDLTALRVDG